MREQSLRALLRQTERIRWHRKASMTLLSMGVQK